MELLAPRRISQLGGAEARCARWPRLRLACGSMSTWCTTRRQPPNGWLIKKRLDSLSKRLRQIYVMRSQAPQPKRCRLCSILCLQAVCHADCSRRLRASAASPVVHSGCAGFDGLLFLFAVQEKKLCVGEFLGSASSLPHCIAFDCGERWLTLLPATRGKR